MHTVEYLSILFPNSFQFSLFLRPFIIKKGFLFYDFKGLLMLNKYKEMAKVNPTKGE
jgi:hypothetical protein